MKGVNSVHILGNLGNKPELTELGNGKKVVRFSLATTEVWTDPSGQKREQTEWHRVVAWNKLADICSKYLDKGMSCFIRGKLKTRSWDDKDTGVKKYSTEILAEDIQFWRMEKRGTSQPSRSNESSKEPDFNYNEDPEVYPSDPSDEIPF